MTAIGYHELRAERRYQFLSQLREGLLARLRGQGDTEYSMSLWDLAETTRRGIALTAGGMSSDDFESLLSDTLDKRFIDFNRQANPTFRAVSRRISFAGFREAKWLAFEFPDLLELGEGGELKIGALSDRSEPIAVSRFGRIAALSRKAIVDDDTGALDAIPSEAARAAMARQGEVFWTFVTQNGGAGPVTRDGNNFFDATNHANVGSTGALSATTVSEAIQLLRAQTDDHGNEMALEPALLVVEPSDEYTARTLLEDAGLRRQLRLLVEPRISGAFYLFASPSTFPAFVRGFVSDIGPRFVARSAFRSGLDHDGIGFKISMAFGIGSGDWRGAVRTPTA